MSALQFKSFSLKKSTQCRHFGGYVVILRQFFADLVNFEKKLEMRLVILNMGLPPFFQEKICISLGSGWMNAPFFSEKTIHRGASEKLFIFPLAVLPPDILPPKCGQIPEIFAILRDGAFLRKRSDARGKVTKMSAMNPIILKNCLGSISLLVEEKIVFQNSKFWKINLIWPHFQKAASH